MIKLFSKKGLAKFDGLYFPEENISWQAPWWNMSENPDLRLGIQKELNKEIGPKHPLWGLKPVVFAKCDANDDVVVHLSDGRFACVHLVWHGQIDQYPDKYPSTEFFDSERVLDKFIKNEIENYT